MRKAITTGLALLSLAAFIGGLFLFGGMATAQEGSPLHPAYPLLDADGENVLDSGAPASTMQTCGTCHDTTFIEEHSLHANRTYEGWNPLTNQAITAGAPTDEWLAVAGARHVGGGVAGDVVEMNCFLCHTTQPNNAARIAALDAGESEWANSATLLDTGILAQDEDGYVWQANAFSEDGTLRGEFVNVVDPTSEHCGQCHGAVHVDEQIPMTLDECSLTDPITATTGQVHSPQRLSNTGLNFTDKATLRRTWDIHAERALACTDCHHGRNNPVYRQEQDPPEHLQFDPRRIDFGEYLQRPVHQFAGEDGTTMRTCDSCHSLEATHDWLPFKEQHTNVLACESCHIPELKAPALQELDWTVLNANGEPRTVYRGVESCGGESPLLTGYEPVLLTGDDGKLTPHNLVTFWYWADENGNPVPDDVLREVWFGAEDDGYPRDVLAEFDANTDGTLQADELVIDTEEKVTLMARRLAELGYDNVEIIGDVRPYEIHHNVVTGEWATKECETCHTEDSRVGAALLIANNVPPGASPIVGDRLEFDVLSQDGSLLYYEPGNSFTQADLYIFGRDSLQIVDWIGVAALLGVFAGVTLHGGLRVLAARNRPAFQEPELKRVYMYTVYERQWHWLQTVAIMLLLFTGLIIHRPDMFGVFSFRYVVQVHNVLGFILVVNAALAAFYHLASGEIRQYLPEPRGFFSDAVQQVMFYGWGIFRGWPHPFDKTPERKLNPLQQMTYLAILNVLLPAQVLTGLLMWFVGVYPAIEQRLGGLTVLAPLHALVAWLFAAFIVLHVYLTTTGHTPLANVQSMMLGWDEVEVHSTEGTTTS